MTLANSAKLYNEAALKSYSATVHFLLDKDKTQNVWTTEDAPRLVHVTRYTKFPPRSKGTVIVTIDKYRLVQIDPLLELDSTQA